MAHGIDEVLAAGETGRRLTSRMSHQFSHGLSDLGVAPVHDADLGTVAKYFPTVMGYPYHWAGKLFQCLGQLYLQLVLQIAVQSGKGLIQQNDPGSGGQDPSQGAALLLPAGELPGPLRGYFLQLEPVQQLLCLYAALPPVGDRGGDVLPYGHVGEEGILLKKIPYPPLLWWYDTASYDKLCLSMFAGMTFCLIVYMVLPNGLDIRPTAEAVGRSNIAMRIMQLLWSADASVNVCPSIHCQSSACMALAFSSSTLTEKRPGLKVLAWVWAALICASTVFTKQHSIVDVVCGLAVAFVWVPVLYRPHRKNS